MSPYSKSGVHYFIFYPLNILHYFTSKPHENKVDSSLTHHILITANTYNTGIWEQSSVDLLKYMSQVLSTVPGTYSQ